MKKHDLRAFLQMTKSMLEAGKTDELLKEIDIALADVNDKKGGKNEERKNARRRQHPHNHD